MKCILVILTLTFSLSLFSQPLEEKLKSAIKRIEVEKLLKQGNKDTAMNIVIEKYAVVPLKDWWKFLYETHLEFSNGMAKLMLISNMKDTAGITDSVTAAPDEGQKKDTSHFDGVTYFKNKYETTDTSVKIYRVLYHAEFETNTGKVKGASLNMPLYVTDLSEVYSFEKK